jgi:hypothetical protein
MSFRSQTLIAGTLFSASLLLGACVAVPALKPIDPDHPANPDGSIPISQIVQRVKCEVYYAVEDKLADRTKYAWLDGWTVQADLNLIVNDQSGITPGLSLINPLNQVTIPQKGTFSQSFSMGIGGSANTTAVRNETVSFSLSLNEISEELSNPATRARLYQDCNFKNGFDLNNNLGLREWVNSSLEPVDDGLLTSGDHKPPKPPGGGGVGSPAKALAAVAAIKQQSKNKASVQSITPGTRLSHYIDLFDTAYAKALKPSPTLADLNAVLSAANNVLTCLNSKACSGFDGDDPRATSLRTMYSQIEAAIRAQMKMPDPPIDAISHQVQFVVAWNANVTPNWSLVNFKGPASGAGALASGTDTNTHTLTIVMGVPNSQALQNSRAALTTGAALGAQLMQFGIVPP